MPGVPRRGRAHLHLRGGARPSRSTWRRTLYRAGAAQGDRVVLMAQNSSQLRPHLVGDGGRRPGRGADQHELRGRVPAPPAGRRPGPVRRHRRRAGRAVGRGRRARPDGRAVLGRRQRRWATRDKAVALLRENGWAADAWEELERGRHRRAAGAEAAGPRRDLLHVRHHRSVQGRRDALLPAVLLRPDRRQPHPADPRRRLPHDHAAVPRQRDVHGGLPGHRRRRPRRDPPQVQRQPVDRPRPRLRRHGHQLRRRDDGLRLEAGAARERPRQPAPGRVRGADGQHHRRRSSRSATGSRRSSTRSASPRRARRSCRPTACRGRRAPPGCRTPSGSTSGWSTPRPTARSRSARSASSWCDRSTRGPAATATTTCRRRPSRPGGTCGSTPATRCGATRTAGSTSSTATRTRCAGVARTSAPTRSSRPSSSTRR